jgi:hypothetical protein
VVAAGARTDACGPGEEARPQAEYGKQAIRLAKRAAHRHGGQRDDLVLYTEELTKTDKTFLATYQPAGGVIRVVIVGENDGGMASFCTNPEATAAQILEAIADRAASGRTSVTSRRYTGRGSNRCGTIGPTAPSTI